MDSKKITVTMIDTAVSRGLKEMSDDPKRTIRKLADMGRQFSTGRFQPMIFEIIQKILENENSPYYELLQYFLSHTDADNAKKFGINMGYYSWTYYARTLRECSREKGYAIPWVINFLLDTKGSSDEGSCVMTISKIKDIISEAKSYGINTFTITLEGGASPDNALFDLFDEFDESAFLLFLGDSQITVAQQDKLKKCGNTMLVINCSSADALATCDALNASGNLYSIYYNYSNEDIISLEKRDFYDRLSLFPASMLFLVPKTLTTKEAGAIVKDIRMAQDCPYFIWDFPYDTEKIGEILCDEQVLLSIDSKGNIIMPRNVDLNILTEKASLDDIFSKLMPKIKIA